MLRAYILSQSSAYLLAGILLLSSRELLSGRAVTCFGEIFIVVAFMLLVSSIRDKFMSKALEINKMLAGGLLQFSLMLVLIDLIFKIKTKI